MKRVEPFEMARTRASIRTRAGKTGRTDAAVTEVEPRSKLTAGAPGGALAEAMRDRLAANPRRRCPFRAARHEWPDRPRLEVLRLISQGLSNRAIASALASAGHGAPARRNTLSKLNVPSRSAAVAQGAR